MVGYRTYEWSFDDARIEEIGQNFVKHLAKLHLTSMDGKISANKTWIGRIDTSLMWKRSLLEWDEVDDYSPYPLYHRDWHVGEALRLYWVRAGSCSRRARKTTEDANPRRRCSFWSDSPPVVAVVLFGHYMQETSGRPFTVYTSVRFSIVVNLITSLFALHLCSLDIGHCCPPDMERLFIPPRHQ